MTVTQTPHEHVTAQVHVVTLKAGIPYETEQQVCLACDKVLTEKPLKRAAA